MFLRRFAIAAFAVPALLAAQENVPILRHVTADLILFNGRVLTVDANNSVAQAVGIAGNRIVAVGTNAEVEAMASPNARRIDLRGRTLTPGLLDAHAHFSGGGGDRLFVIDLSYPNVKTMADVAKAIREKAATLPHGTWIEGRGWDEGKLTERRLITAKDLDRASPENPVYLTQTTGHYGVANSLALRLANITKDTQDTCRHDRPQSRRHADRNHEGRRTRARTPPHPRAHARRERSGHSRDREGVQRRGDDGPQGSRYLGADVGPL